MRLAKSWAPMLTVCTLTLSIALVGCGKDAKQDKQEQAQAQQQMPAPQVGVVVAQPQSIENTVELSGRTAAYQISEVRPQASGVILKRLFTEGSFVREGQALYELDDRTNKAALDTAKAALRHKCAWQKPMYKQVKPMCKMHKLIYSIRRFVHRFQVKQVVLV